MSRIIKEKAQAHLMTGMQAAFNQVPDLFSSCFEAPDCYSPEEMQEVLTEMDKQMRRVEKLFGYTPGSWGRGV